MLMKSFSNATALSMAQESLQNKRKKDSLFFPFSLQNPQPMLKPVAPENNFLRTRVFLQVFHITCGTKTPNNLEHRNLLMHSKPQEVPEQILSFQIAILDSKL